MSHVVVCTAEKLGDVAFLSRIRLYFSRQGVNIHGPLKSFLSNATVGLCVTYSSTRTTLHHSAYVPHTAPHDIIYWPEIREGCGFVTSWSSGLGKFSETQQHYKNQNWECCREQTTTLKVTINPALDFQIYGHPKIYCHGFIRQKNADRFRDFIFGNSFCQYVSFLENE